jgi:hypothetical protein
MSDREEAQHLFDRVPDQRSIMTQHLQLCRSFHHCDASPLAQRNGKDTVRHRFTRV